MAERRVAGIQKWQKLKQSGIILHISVVFWKRFKFIVTSHHHKVTILATLAITLGLDFYPRWSIVWGFHLVSYWLSHKQTKVSRWMAFTAFCGTAAKYQLLLCPFTVDCSRSNRQALCWDLTVVHAKFAKFGGRCSRQMVNQCTCSPGQRPDQQIDKFELRPNIEN